MKNKRIILKPIAISSVLALIFMLVFSFATFAATDEGKEENTPRTFGEFSPGEGSESLARGDKSQSGSQFGGKDRAASGQNGGNSRDGGLVIKERASETGEEGQSGQSGEGKEQFGMTPPEGFTPGGNGGFKGGRGGMTPPDGEGFRPFGNTDAGYTSGETDSNSNTPLLIAVIAEGVVIIGLAVTLALTLAKKKKQTVSQTAGAPVAPVSGDRMEYDPGYHAENGGDHPAAQTFEQNTEN